MIYMNSEYLQKQQLKQQLKKDDFARIQITIKVNEEDKDDLVLTEIPKV